MIYSLEISAINASRLAVWTERDNVKEMANSVQSSASRTTIRIGDQTAVDMVLAQVRCRTPDQSPTGQSQG